MENQKNTPTQWISTLLLFVFGTFMLFLPSCKPIDPLPTVNKTSIVTPTSFGRANQKLGCLDISGKSITISVWDSGTVDGDIVSVYVNGSLVIDEVTMGGAANKTTVDVTLDYAGFNDIKLFAHNMGSVGENTAAMTITDDSGPKNFSINSNLTTNGYFDVVVSGSGVSCGASSTPTTTPTPTNNNASLFGDWVKNNSNGRTISISNTTAILKAYGSPSSGLLKIGDDIIRNISPKGTNKWSCNIVYTSIKNGAEVGLLWSTDGTITLSTDGRSITVGATTPNNGASSSGMYTETIFTKK